MQHLAASCDSAEMPMEYLHSAVMISAAIRNQFLNGILPFPPRTSVTPVLGATQCICSMGRKNILNLIYPTEDWTL